MLKGSRQAILKRIQPISIHGQASWEIVFTHVDDPTEQLNAARVGPEAISPRSRSRPATASTSSTVQSGDQSDTPASARVVMLY